LGGIKRRLTSTESAEDPEYARFFGQPPTRDIKTLRDGKVVATNVA
jgi:hypothetical protein